jgi:hypothetical protein
MEKEAILENNEVNIIVHATNLSIILQYFISLRKQFI